MDRLKTTSLSSGMKRVKTLVDDDADDKFNTLHVDLLLDIINFLPTKDALRTCVLSSRWRYLWRCISNIDLTFHNNSIPLSLKPDDSFLFLDLIDNLLVRHGSSCDIKRFSVECIETLVDGARIHPWISEAINHNVQDLCIHCNMDPVKPPGLLPLCLFKSQSLTVLEIELLGQKTSFGSESSLFSVHLPSLKILKLRGVSFLNNYTVENFFSNTPKLQHLCLLGCYWEEAINRIGIPTLERLEVSILGRRSHGSCDVIVNAPNLTYFKCVTNFAINFLLSNHSLSLDVYLQPRFIEDGGGRAALVRLLESFKRLRVLHVSWDFTKWLSHEGTEDMPFLTNLRELVISPDLFCGRDDIYLEKVFMLLHKIPNLQSLAIVLTKCCPTKCCPIHPLHDDRPPSGGGVPSCVVHQIKKFSISNSCGFYYDKRASDYSTAMSSIKYFMNHSQSLKILNVDWYHYSHMVQEITDGIKRHPRFSDFNNVVSIRDHTGRRTKHVKSLFC